ncbi:MAG: uracil-DNA glycosylase [Sphingomonas sp.]
MPAPSPIPAAEAPHDCPRCPRLVGLRAELRAQHPEWWNAPVPAFGDPNAWLAIVGLAPGKHGANRTGRAFTGDAAGDLLFATLARFGLTRGVFRSSPDDGLTLDGAVIVNAVKCLPPQNKPVPEEIHACRPHLEAAIAALPRVRVLIALGRIAHESTVRALGGRPAAAPFAHLAEHRLEGRVLIDSYHCSRYNTNTGRLTREMFEAVFARALAVRP